MTVIDIIRYRLCNQQIACIRFRRPEEIVEWQGAVQAQDYPGGLWGIGLRLPGTTLDDIEKALTDRKIIRTWPMRGTLHFVPARDAGWMLELLTPRVIRRSAGRYKELGLTEEIFERSKELFTKALEGGRQLTRDAMYEVLAKGGIVPDGQRGYHIIGHLAQKGVICFGTREGRQQTFVLFDEWVADSKRLERDEALAELARRYFTSHGPATLQDFIWWTGLTTADAKAGLEMVKPHLMQEVIDGKLYWFTPSSSIPAINDRSPIACLLPNYDEYMIGYKDRSAMFPILPKKLDSRGNIAFNHTIIINGITVGGWRRESKRNESKKDDNKGKDRKRKDTRKKDSKDNGIVIKTRLFRPLDKAEKEALAIAVNRYGEFLETAVLLS